MIKVLRRVWLPLLIVVAVAIGGLAVTRLRTVFGANPVVITPKGSTSAADFDPKVVTYEVFGSTGPAVINYMDLDGEPQRATSAQLPWTLTLTTTLSSASANILAQSQGQAITCRITVDAVIKDERTATGVNAQTYCLVKAA